LQAGRWMSGKEGQGFGQPRIGCRPADAAPAGNRQLAIVRAGTA